MGTIAGSVTTISEDFVKSICVEEFQALQDAIDIDDVDLEFVASDLNNDFGGVSANIVKALNDLTDKFKNETGLDLDIFYHSEDDGDRYDDFFGYTWVLSPEEVFQYTPKAEKLKTIFQFNYLQYLVKQSGKFPLTGLAIIINSCIILYMSKLLLIELDTYKDGYLLETCTFLMEDVEYNKLKEALSLKKKDYNNYLSCSSWSIEANTYTYEQVIENFT